MSPQNYTWAQFVQEVLKLLPVDASRKGIGSSQTDFRTSLIRQAVVRLQSSIDYLRLNHESVYEISDFVQEGSALRAVKPPQSIIRDAWFCKTEDGECTRYPTVHHDWSDRFSLVNGVVGVNDRKARFCIDPSGYTFYLYPAPPEDECWQLSLFWDGLKLNFRDCEETPFPEIMVGAVAHFMKAMIALEVDKDPVTHEKWMSMFDSAKTMIYTTLKEQTMLKKG